MVTLNHRPTDKYVADHDTPTQHDDRPDEIQNCRAEQNNRSGARI